jgi:nucleotide-binding universal stress UspA family protein
VRAGSGPAAHHKRKLAPVFTKIIVGIDGADGGNDAVALARILGKPDSDITLLNAYSYDAAPSRGLLTGYARLLRDESDELLARAAGTNPDPLQPDTHVRHVADVSPSRALQHTAAREEANLIVVGSCHRGAVGRAVLGDVSRGVLHGAPCPVAVASHGYRDDPHVPRSIGVGFNDTPESRGALEFAASLAAETGATLKLMTSVMIPASLSTPSAFSYDVEGLLEELRAGATDALGRAASGLGPFVTTSVTEGPAGPALAQLSEEVDLVVAGSRGWGTAKRVMLGSATSHLTHHAACPVIVVPTPIVHVDEAPLVAAGAPS